MKTDTSKSTEAAPARTPTYEEISRRAYELWEKDGRPEGNEQQHWYQAEKELSQGQAARPASAAAPRGSTSASAPASARKTTFANSATSAPSSPGPAQSGSKQPAKASAGRL